MDPLSVSASIIALLQLSGTIIKYLSDVRDAPTRFQQLRREISSLLPILIAIQEQADSTPQDNLSSSSLQSLKVPNGPFDLLHTALNQIESKLAPVEGWRKLGKKIKWPFQKE